jgi:hypothetical protein
MFSAFFKKSAAANEADAALLSQGNDALHDRVVKMLRQNQIHSSLHVPAELQTPMAVKKAFSLERAIAA